MIPTVKTYHFLKHYKQTDLWNSEVLCFFCGTDWILKYYLDNLRLQRVNRIKTIKFNEKPDTVSHQLAYHKKKLIVIPTLEKSHKRLSVNVDL
jgi:hypothetical protein